MPGPVEEAGTVLSSKDRLSLRLEVVREILSVLDTATNAGQQVLMGKVLDLLRREALKSETEGDAIASHLESLSRETERPAPDAASFARSAGRVVEALRS
jgi:hypothetical protein